MTNFSAGPGIEPDVSIILPVYNVADFLHATLRSLQAQEGSAFEIIAVNDGSTDGSGEALTAAMDWEWRPGCVLRVHHQSNSGAAAARNTALELAHAPRLMFMDADDILRPGALGVLTGALDASPETQFVFGRYAYIDAAGRPIGTESQATKARYGISDLLSDNPVHSASGVMVRREACMAAGRFDESLRACIDLDYWVRIGLARQCAYEQVDRVLVDYRKRDAQITSDWRRMRAGWNRVMEKTAAVRPDLVEPIRREALARHAIYWSTIAYSRGEFGDARALMREGWRAAPLLMASDPRARLRTLACLASRLPEPVHARIANGFNARRQRTAQT